MLVSAFVIFGVIFSIFWSSVYFSKNSNMFTVISRKKMSLHLPVGNPSCLHLASSKSFFKVMHVFLENTCSNKFRRNPQYCNALFMSLQALSVHFVIQQRCICHPFPVGIYMFKINNRNTRRRCEICSKLTIKTPERRQWRLGFKCAFCNTVEVYLASIPSRHLHVQN